MNRRKFLALGGAGAAAVGLGLIEAMSDGSAQPNLLVIMTDDQPYYTIALYVEAEDAPYMEAVVSHIQKQGITFEPYAYVSTPICGPARATLLTGKWSHNTGLTATEHPVAYRQLHNSSYESHTIATRIKNAGYATYFGGKYTNGYDGKAMPPGWDSWFAMVEPLNEKDAFRYRSNSGIKKYDRSKHNETDVLSASAEGFLRNPERASQPWFAYVCPHAPHGPYFPAKRHVDEFTRTHLRDPDVEAKSSGTVGEKDLRDKPGWVQHKAPYTANERRADTKEYRGKLRELQEVDDMVARLMGALADTVQLNNTYVFFLTDNGYLLGEHGLHSKDIPYEEASRTPFIVRVPNLPSTHPPSTITSDVMVSHIDLPPTLLHLARASYSGLDGRSLVPIFESGGGRPGEGWVDEIFVEDVAGEIAGQSWYMLRTPEWAYVEWEHDAKELYDMNSDPFQLNSLHKSRTDIVGQLSERLRSYKQPSS